MTDTYLKFANHLLPNVLDGSKTVTARYGFDESVTEGDILSVLDADRTQHGKVEVLFVSDMSIESFTRFNFSSHGFEGTASEFCEQLGTYYPNAELTPETTLTVIGFEVIHT